ncbi:MAG: hypothetical protein A3J59_04720 [Candidatus Buchananbacteria bacterium RIFCSPHIGHO2_02_FULL_56_16]|uniref:Transcriptional repressor n=1 Tax=Candidatus Buchananbacteria bacterium RIFCSPHIGHO2_02_FULL_56_16 TaxID=1797542 RepID=A0A1G1YCX1_9BACT|nr:MAG: hypothetical protein A3J59_04720 [Candidatus Buchananbacteria bacterium RIFCSPHIGHO2_02_FULL_56_16]
MEMILRQKRLKATPGRLAMLKCLAANNHPISAETIHTKLKQRFDLVTIYRNLEAFERSGIVFRETMRKTDCFYLADAPHHHIFCRSCEAVACVACDHKIVSVPNFKNIAHRLVLTGICRKCVDA